MTLARNAVSIRPTQPEHFPPQFCTQAQGRAFHCCLDSNRIKRRWAGRIWSNVVRIDRDHAGRDHAPIHRHLMGGSVRKAHPAQKRTWSVLSAQVTIGVTSDLSVLFTRNSTNKEPEVCPPSGYDIHLTAIGPEHAPCFKERQATAIQRR